jgi:hypothetical protein
VFRDVDVNCEWEQEDKMVVKEGARMAEGVGDSTRSCGLEWKHNMDVRQLRAAHAGNLNSTWGRRWEHYEAQV